MAGAGNPLMSNQELAEGYGIVACTMAGDILNYVRIRTVIAEAPVNLVEYYKQHGSFKKLQVPGIGAGTKELLEMVLQYGVDEAVQIKARRIMQQEREKHRPEEREEDDDLDERCQ